MLPIAIHGFVTEGVCQSMSKLARFFRWVCSKNVDIRDLDLMKKKSAIMTSLLQMQLPMCFFDSQIHLISHLVEEVAIGGPVSYHWMFPIKRYLKTLKGFVRQTPNQKGVWVKAILCRRLWEFATILLETWTSMHLGCGKRKKMNIKQVWTIAFEHYIYCVFFLFYLDLIHHF